MYLMPQYAPQGLGPGDTPTFAGIKGPNGQTITGSAAGAWTITANGTNQSVVLTPVGTGGILAGINGSAANPVYSFSSGITDGLFWIGAGRWGLSGGGTERMRVNSTDNRILFFSTIDTQGNTINIGATTPATITGDNGAVTIAAAGSNKSITLTPSGTGDVSIPVATNHGIQINAAGNAVINSVGGGSQLILQTAGTNAVVIDGSQNPTFSGLTQNYGGAAGAANTATCFQKLVTGIANATATTVLTVTIPNAAHSASIRVRLVGSLGAGGAIGANEATGTSAYDIAIARTAGVNAVGIISTIFGSANAPVAGAATITVTAALGAVSGAVGASNTIAIQVTITRGSGTSTNHTCIASAEVINANATGITIA